MAHSHALALLPLGRRAAMRRSRVCLCEPDPSVWWCGLGWVPRRRLGASAARARRSTRRKPSPRSLPSMPLGIPLPPADEHAISASMPLWAHVVGYEEGDPYIHEQLTLGYPRFVYHPTVRELFEHVEDTRGNGDEAMVVFPSEAAAVRCQAFIERFLAGVRADEPRVEPPRHSRLVPVFDDVPPEGTLQLTAVAVPVEHEYQLKRYWQHTGEVVTSRVAKLVLEQLQNPDPQGSGDQAPHQVHGHRSVPLAKSDVVASLRRSLADISGANAEDIYLFQSGMSAIFNAHRLASNLCLMRENPTASPKSLTDPTGTFGKSAVFGFPYLDTLKLLEHGSISGGAIFYSKGDDEELRQLGERLQAARSTNNGSLEPLQAIFCEHPTNPLLNLPPLSKLAALARDHRLPLVVDDTVGFGYWSLLDDERLSTKDQPDIVVSSLSKVFSGVGNCMGGALFLNNTSPLYSELKPLLDAQYEPALSHPDALTLLDNSRDLPRRLRTIAANAAVLARFLETHPLVKRVHYAPTPLGYTGLKGLPGGGAIGLMSVVLTKDAAAPVFFDALNVAKGPGFGTNFTLACPYTLLAHYTELEWAAECGVAPSLVRVWVGLDPQEHLLKVFDKALDAAAAALYNT